MWLAQHVNLSERRLFWQHIQILLETGLWQECLILKVVYTLSFLRIRIGRKHYCTHEQPLIWCSHVSQWSRLAMGDKKSCFTVLIEGVPTKVLLMINFFFLIWCKPAHPAVEKTVFRAKPHKIQIHNSKIICVINEWKVFSWRHWTFSYCSARLGNIINIKMKKLSIITVLNLQTAGSTCSRFIISGRKAEPKHS